MKNRQPSDVLWRKNEGMVLKLTAAGMMSCGLYAVRVVWPTDQGQKQEVDYFGVRPRSTGKKNRGVKIASICEWPAKDRVGLVGIRIWYKIHGTAPTKKWPSPIEAIACH